MKSTIFFGHYKNDWELWHDKKQTINSMSKWTDDFWDQFASPLQKKKNSSTKTSSTSNVELEALIS